jgi:hypothetical protein
MSSTANQNVLEQQLGDVSKILHLNKDVTFPLSWGSVVKRNKWDVQRGPDNSVGLHVDLLRRVRLLDRGWLGYKRRDVWRLRAE